MNAETIVICMSVYNGMHFLQRQIESIQGQTESNWLLLIHDDGSNDGTQKLVAKMAASDDRIHLASNSGHLGIRQAFLQTLSLIDSGYYAFCDQDDIWHADKLEKLVIQLKMQDPETPALIYSDYDEIDADDSLIQGHNARPRFVTGLNGFLMTNTLTGCTCLFNRALRNQLIAPLSDFDYTQIHMHDWWAGLVASALGQVIFDSEQLISYRQHDHNVLGARTEDSRWQRLFNIFRLADIALLQTSVNQARLLQKCYGAQLEAPVTQTVQVVANMLDGWHPRQTWRQLQAYGLLAGPSFLMRQLRLLLWLPAPLRVNVLRKRIAKN